MPWPMRMGPRADDERLRARASAAPRSPARRCCRSRASRPRTRRRRCRPSCRPGGCPTRSRRSRTCSGRRSAERGDLLVGEAEPLRLPEQVAASAARRAAAAPCATMFVQLVAGTRVDRRCARRASVDVDAAAQRRHERPEALVVRRRSGQALDVAVLVQLGVLPEERPAADLERAHRLLQRRLERCGRSPSPRRWPSSACRASGRRRGTCRRASAGS